MPNFRENRTQQKMELQIQATIEDTTPRYEWAQLLSLLFQQIGENVPSATVRDWRYGLNIKPDKPTRKGKYSKRDLVWLKGWGLWRRSYSGTTFGAYRDWLHRIVEQIENGQNVSENITEIEVPAHECK